MGRFYVTQRKIQNVGVNTRNESLLDTKMLELFSEFGYLLIQCFTLSEMVLV